MQPTGDFWDGVGQGVASADGWMVVVAITLIVVVIGALFVVARYIYPGHKEIRMKREENEREVKMRELDIREREAENDRDRIKANAALAENMRGLRESNDTLSTTNAAMLARLNESAVHSKEMGTDVSETKEIAKHTDSLVIEMHRHMFKEGTD